MYYKISLNKIFKFLNGENKIPFLFNFISLKYRKKKNKINLKQENRQKKVVKYIEIEIIFNFNVFNWNLID